MLSFNPDTSRKSFTARRAVHNLKPVVIWYTRKSLSSKYRGLCRKGGLAYVTIGIPIQMHTQEVTRNPRWRKSTTRTMLCVRLLYVNPGVVCTVLEKRVCILCRKHTTDSRQRNKDSCTSTVQRVLYFPDEGQ